MGIINACVWVHVRRHENDETLNFLMMFRMFVFMTCNPEHFNEKHTNNVTWREDKKIIQMMISMIAIPLMVSIRIDQMYRTVSTKRKSNNSFQLHLKSNIYSFNYPLGNTGFHFPLALSSRIKVERNAAIFFPIRNRITVNCTIIFINDSGHLSSLWKNDCIFEHLYSAAVCEICLR